MNFPIKRLLSVAALAALAFDQAGAAILTFQPKKKDIDDLSHDYAYQWGINSEKLLGETVTKATLRIDNIRDWRIENDDILYVRLLPSAPSGILRYFDDEGGGDYFQNTGINLVTWNDLLPYTKEELKKKKTVDLVYDFSVSELGYLNTYIADGGFGLGFDPDCHYYNTGIKLTLETRKTPPPPEAVPEPGAMALMALGLLGLGYAHRRRRKA